MRKRSNKKLKETLSEAIKEFKLPEILREEIRTENKPLIK